MSEKNDTIPIYKIHHLINKTTTKTIYVFYGESIKKNLDIAKDFQDSINEDIYLDPISNTIIFNEDEMNQIREKKIDVVFSKQQIHFDDSIGIIKLKIVNEFKDTFSPEEIYLFGQKEEKLNTINIYESLTQKGKLKINKIRLHQFLDNILENEDGEKYKFNIPDKDNYDYNDLLALNINEKSFLINKVLGQKFFIVSNEYPFTINPFEVNNIDNFINKASIKSLTTLNNNLLLNSGNINNNNIFLCLAGDVLREKNNEDMEEYLIKIYYPLLYNEDVDSLNSLKNNKYKLIENNKKILNKSALENFKSVDMFYDVYKYKTSELNYKTKGIKNLKFVMLPEYNIKIPLDVVFKIIHATELNPLIKYNTSTRQEKIYRLYTDKIATDGRKIPYLEKSEISKLMKTIGRNKSVAVHINYDYDGTIYNINCEFEENGNIIVSSKFDKIVELDNVDSLLSKAINPIIEQVKNYLEQNGYIIHLFSSLNNQNIDIKILTYETEIEFDKLSKMSFGDIKGCISSVFVIETTDVTNRNGMKLRFKRVSNFNKRNSQEAFVIEKMKEKEYSRDELIELLLENYKEMNRNDAIDLISKMITELEINKSARRKQSEIKINPGFPLIIKENKFTNTFSIEVDNIDDIYYLDTIPIYIDSLMRLTQDKGSTSYPQKLIKSVCSGEERVDIAFVDRVSISEASLSEQSEIPYIENDEVKYETLENIDDSDEAKRKAENAISMFFGNDDDEEEEEEEEEQGFVFRGGDNSSSSFDSFGENVEVVENKPTPTSESSFMEDEVNVSTTQQEKTPTPTPTQTPTSESSFMEDEVNVSQTQQQKTPTPTSESSFMEDEVNVSPTQKEKTPTPTPTSESSFMEDEVNVSPTQKEKTPTPTKDGSSFMEYEVEAPLETEKPPTKEESSFMEDEVEAPLETEVPPTKEESSFMEEEVEAPLETEIPPTKKETPVIKMPSDEEDESEEEEVIITKKPTTQQKIILEDASTESSTEDIEIIQKPKTKKERNIDGMPISNDNSYFQNRIEERDPVLILKKDQGKYSRYSRICESSARRQPVILDKEELDKINEEHPGFLKDEDVVQYSSNPDKDFYYICPQYWDLKNETVLTEEEIKKNKLEDKIIPKGVNKVPKGKYIYKFKDTKQYPNFIKGDKHPDGFCLPCCVSKFNTPAVVGTREKCTGQIKAAKLLREKEKTKTNKRSSYDSDSDSDSEESKTLTVERIQEQGKMKDYVKGPEKFPLEPDRWGYLPTAIQRILQEINASCQISKTNTNIKPNHACMLRHGVEQSNSQSFIACISDAIFYTRKDEEGNPFYVSIEKMKELIIKSLNIDNFIKFQNGNLVTEFNEPERVINEEKMNKYKSSKLYQILMKNNNDENTEYFKNVCSSFENFIAFLRDKHIKIDHTYLWDIVTSPNQYLFPKGINLVIMEIPNEDVTNNVDLICPTNHYSMKSYDSRLPTLILVKQSEYYEPIYTYKFDSVKNKLFITKIFSERDPHLSQQMHDFFDKIVKPFYDNIDNNYSVTCKPQNSISKNIFKMEHAVNLDKIIQILTKKKYTIEKQVVNYQSKVIGIIAKSSTSDVRGFIPCYPSSINNNYDFVFMIEDDLWNDYPTTMEFLINASRATNRETKSMPVFKIIEGEMVVGILTETNQLVQLSKPYPVSSVRDDIPMLRNTNYLIQKEDNKDEYIASDIAITTTHKTDKKREEYIKKIKLETNFFNVFRNTIRTLLNNYTNADLREEIEDEMVNKFTMYSAKLSKINSLLRELVKRTKSIKFIDNSTDENKKFFDNYSLESFNTCAVNNSEEKCNSKAPMCEYNKGEKDICTLILPLHNLLPDSDLNNDKYYFARMADELIRYNRIKSFILQPQIYLSFSPIGYNLRDDEIILLESILVDREYFDDLKIAPFNKYVKYNTYDSAEPSKSILYENMIEFDKNLNTEHIVRECKKPVINKISTMRWKNCFPSGSRELDYDKSAYCSFQFIIDIIKNKTNNSIRINELRSILYEEYKKYLPDYDKQILDILIEEGKKGLVSQVRTNKINFENMIFLDNYFLTTFDYWLLVNKFEIPTFFVSKMKMKTLTETNHKSFDFLGYGNMDDSFVFIVVPGLRTKIIPQFKAIINIQGEKKSMSFKLNELNDCDEIADLRRAFDDGNKMTIEEFLKSFKKRQRKNKNNNNNKSKKVVFQVEEDEDEEEKSQKETQTQTQTQTVKDIIKEIIPTSNVVISNKSETKPSSSEIVVEKKQKTTKKTRKTRRKNPKTVDTRRSKNTTKKSIIVVESDSDTE